MHHFRSTHRSYKAHRSNDQVQGGCPFCQDTTIPARTVNETKTMLVISIRTRYDVFEGRRVTDHLMIIPKRHTESIADFNNQEKIDTMSLIGEYEAKGYNVYARGVGSVSRSVAHQHTHLIKLVEKPTKYLIHIKKPYVLING